MERGKPVRRLSYHLGEIMMPYARKAAGEPGGNDRFSICFGGRTCRTEFLDMVVKGRYQSKQLYCSKSCNKHLYIRLEMYQY